MTNPSSQPWQEKVKKRQGKLKEGNERTALHNTKKSKQ